MNELRHLFSYMGKYRKDLYIAMFFIAVETALELAIPSMMADLVDIGAMNKDIPYMLQKGGEMAFCALLALVTGLSYARFGARAAYGWGAELRDAEFRKVEEFSFSNIDKFETSSLVTRMTADATVMQNAITGGLRPLVRSPLMCILGIFFSFRMNPELSLVFICLTPILAFILFFIIRKVSPRYIKQQKALDRLNMTIEENVRAIRTVKAFVREDYENMKFDDASSNLRDIGIDTQSHAVLNLPAFQICMYTSIVLIMYFGGEMINLGSLQVGVLTGFLSYVMQVLNSMMMLSNVFLLLTRSMASAHRINEVLIEKPSITTPPDCIYDLDDSSIEFRNVSFKYSAEAKEFALENLSFRIGSGESIGIVGGTGSGKTSLVQLIARLYEATSGEIYVGGNDIRRYDLHALRNNVGIVLQKNLLFSGTIRDNLRWGDKDATDEELLEVLENAQAKDFVLAFPDGLSENLGQAGVNVSGGQKQRLAIARTLLKKPKILIFDDSLSAVDTRTEASILKSLKSFEGTTKIFIAQRISTIMDMDRTIVLDGGRIESFASHEELMRTSRIYQEVFSSQMKGGSYGDKADQREEA